MSDNYWIKNRGRTNGPFPIETLKQMAARGQFSTAFQISEDGNSWERADSIPELFAVEEKEELISTESESSLTEDSLYKTVDQVESLNDSKKTLLWRFVNNGKPSEPITFEQLKKLALKDIIQPNGLVWNETLPNWIKAKDVSGLEFRQKLQPSRGVSRKSKHPKDEGSLSQLAVASFVCGVAGASSGLFILLGILAIIFGHVSLYKEDIRNGTLRGRGLAIAGLSIGWFCLLIMPVLFYFILMIFVFSASGANV
jgi:Domain of unknown function (DUF4190)/GYF domain 2